MANTSINFPVHTRLNPDGQFDKLVKNGDNWALSDTTTHQTKELPGKALEEALKAVVEPLMS